MRGKRPVWGVACLVLALAIVLGILFCTPLGQFVLSLIQVTMQQNAGVFDKPRFEAVVDEVRRLGLKPNESVELRLDDINTSKSLRLRKSNEVFYRGQGVGNVWATLTASGKLEVVIETRDLGHAGEYGFAYSEIPLSPSPSSWGKDVLQLDLPSHLQAPARKMDDNWWEVYNPLMD